MVGMATFAAGLPGLIVGAVLLCFPEIVLTIAFGEYYAQAAPLLQMLAIGQIVCILTGPCENVLMMTGHQNKTLIVNIVAAFLIFAFGLFAIQNMGIIGLAITMCSITTAQNLFNWWLAKRLLGISTGFNVTYVQSMSPRALKQLISSKGKIHAH